MQPIHMDNTYYSQMQDTSNVGKLFMNKWKNVGIFDKFEADTSATLN